MLISWKTRHQLRFFFAQRSAIDVELPAGLIDALSLIFNSLKFLCAHCFPIQKNKRLIMWVMLRCHLVVSLSLSKAGLKSTFHAVQSILANWGRIQILFWLLNRNAITVSQMLFQKWKRIYMYALLSLANCSWKGPSEK